MGRLSGIERERLFQIGNIWLKTLCNIEYTKLINSGIFYWINIQNFWLNKQNSELQEEG